jgi:hypothetical protein
MPSNTTTEAATFSKIPFWSNQIKAIGVIRKYLNAFHNGTTSRASLVQMPTGSGKSAVITAAIHFLKKSKCVLVLTPRKALRDQLAQDIGGKFFSKFDLHLSNNHKKVHNIQSGFKNFSDISYDKKEVFVMTIQLFQNWKNSENVVQTNLLDEVDTIIVDEGHYEPAMSWGNTIRSMNKPKIILTATPFRNDLKCFDIDINYAYCYSHCEAERDNIIRSVEVIPKPHPNNAPDFINEILDIYNQKIHDIEFSEGEDPRIIIRCENHVSIRQIGNAIANTGKSYVLIHENFDDTKGNGNERKSVPNPDETDALFWVHQYKLTEGIDDSRFRFLALYEELKQARSLIQQVGRVIRNPQCVSDAKAFLIDHSGGRQNKMWESYLNYDRVISKHGVRSLDHLNNLVNEISNIQPEVIYLDGGFRTKFSIEDFDPNDDLLLQSSANIFLCDSNMDIGSTCQNIHKTYQSQDKVSKLIKVDQNTFVLVYVILRNSPLLKTTHFIESKLGITIVQKVDNYICYFDSEGSIPQIIKLITKSLSLRALRRLFTNGNEAFLTSVSLTNTDLNKNSIRTRAISAVNIDNTIPTFNDHAFICTTARGRSKLNNQKNVGRYVGFQHGKISDRFKTYLTFREYLEWLNDITILLGKKKKVSSAFNRYAEPAGIPMHTEPRNILVDLTEASDVFITNEYNGIPKNINLEIEDLCLSITNGQFTMKCNSVDFAVNIRYDTNQSQYFLESTDLDVLYRSKNKTYTKGLIGYLNANQSFRVLPQSNNRIYAFGEFYEPILRFGRSFDDSQIGLLQILQGCVSLASIGSEKGINCREDETGWDTNSLFNIIDQSGRGFNLEEQFDAPDIIVCDDMGTEAADFIIANDSLKRVVFIHAKGNNGAEKYYSASALHDVCGQATKNLKYFNRFVNNAPPKAEKWHKSGWSDPSNTTGKVKDRIRRNTTTASTGSKLWQNIFKIISSPNADMQVWLFLGRLFSKSRFQSELERAKPRTEAIQAAYLLFSTMNDVASVGARLKIFCSP